ncbi:hypothetical protein NQZ68_005615 [Dissostichus eleginoides]|nr:hypothetical protein NQZ68_005615 [Dissostichus eleginoides]
MRMSTNAHAVPYHPMTEIIKTFSSLGVAKCMTNKAKRDKDPVTLIISGLPCSGRHTGTLWYSALQEKSQGAVHVFLNPEARELSRELILRQLVVWLQQKLSDSRPVTNCPMVQGLLGEGAIPISPSVR